MEQEYAEDIRISIRELNLPVESVVYIPRAPRRRRLRPENTFDGTGFRVGGWPDQSEIPLRKFRGRVVQSVCACGGASGREQSVAQLQSAVHLRRRR